MTFVELETISPGEAFVIMSLVFLIITTIRPFDETLLF